ncbi:MAG TPA: hypothetical protein VFA65_21425 [Bryobacteraceae bacterium]|nr:hypothetical protein [Bryobacteraceae bacterium]
MRSLFLSVLFLSGIAAQPCLAQFMTTLDPRTVEEFDAYAKHVEAQLQQRWDGKQAFFLLDENPSERAKVKQGELWIEPGNSANPVSVYQGLIHDWIGAAFIPNASMQKVLEILQDFNRHSQIYPNITQSRLIRRDGNEITGFWRLERRQGLVSVVLDVKQDAHWRQIAPGKWVCRAYANDISEIEHPGSHDEKKLPVGRSRGFLWRLYAYWSLEAVDGGVLAECRTLSLSRDIPPAVAWAIQPFVSSLPREALTATLRDTKAAASK